MYLKGYRIIYDSGKRLTFPKWDFGGDKPHTNRVWEGILSKLRALSLDSYPMSIIDLDKEDCNSIIINNQQDFELWLKKDF